MIRDIIETAKAAYQISYCRAAGKTRLVPCVAQFEYEGNHITINYDPLFVKSLGTKTAALTKEADGRILISVDDIYMNATIPQREFILAHEVGHLMNKDLEKKLGKFSMFRRSIKALYTIDEPEVKADNFAANLVGKEAAINCLNYLNTIPGIQSKEITRRIGVIQTI